MKIKELKIKNFRSIVNMTINLENPVVLTSDNGKGKTSVELALRYLLTGKAGNIPASDLVRKGASGMSVSAVLMDGQDTEIERILNAPPACGADGSPAAEARSGKCLVDGRVVTAKAFSSLLSDRFGCNAEAFDILTSSEMTAAMNMKDFSGYLLKILPVRADAKALFDRAGTPEDERSLIEPLLPSAPAHVTVPDIQSAYKLLYETRREIGRDLANLKGRATYDGQKPSMTSAEIRERADKVNIRIGEEKRREKERKDREKSLATLSEWTKEYESMKDVSRPDEGMERELAESERSLRDAKSGLLKQAAALREAAAPLKRMLSDLSSDKCPLCDRLVCQTDKSSVRGELSSAVERDEAMACDAERKVAELDGRISEILKKEDDFRRKTEIWRKKEDLLKRIESLKRSIPEAPFESEGNMESLTMEAAELSDGLRNAMAYEETVKASEECEALKKKRNLYDRAVRDCDPNGGSLANAVTGILLEPMKKDMNRFASSVDPDFGMQFETDGNGLKLMCSPRGMDGFIPAGSLSTGEMMIATLSMMEFATSASGAGIMVFDSAESLDAGHYAALLNILSRMAEEGTFETVIVASVNRGSESSAYCGGFKSVAL